MTVFTDNQLMKSEITFFGADGLLDTSDLDLAPHDFYFPTVVRSGDEAFLQGKLLAAEYWIHTEVPRLIQLAALCRSGEDSYARVRPDEL